MARLAKIVRVLWDFGWLQARACLFAGAFFVLLFLSTKLPLGPLARYDFLFLAALGLQGLLLAFRLETPKEALAVAVFHLVGLGLELFKTSPEVGSWSYPEPGFFRVGTVPLYAGFMYAAVGSYMLQSWTVMRLRFEPFPPAALGVALCVLVYANFFTNHWLPDARWVLLAAIAVVYGRTWVHFEVSGEPYRMPLLLAFVLIAFFIWVAENIATFFGAWEYPDQSERWSMVSVSKISSWSLLVIISFLLVASVRSGTYPSRAASRSGRRR